MRISDWSSDVCSSDLRILPEVSLEELKQLSRQASLVETDPAARAYVEAIRSLPFIEQTLAGTIPLEWAPVHMVSDDPAKGRSEEHTSELQSLMRISYAVFCLKKKKHRNEKIHREKYTD